VIQLLGNAVSLSQQLADGVLTFVKLFASVAQFFLLLLDLHRSTEHRRYEEELILMVKVKQEVKVI